MNATLQCCAVALAAVAMAGCRTGENDFPRIINEPMPVPPAQRSSFGVIGILPADLAAHFEFGQPARPGEAMGVIGTTAFVGLVNTSTQNDEGHPGRQLEDIAFSAALAGVIGVFGGVLAGVPEGDVKRAQAAMSQALQDNPLEAGIQKQLEQSAGKNLFQNLVPLPVSGAARLNGTAIAKKDLRKLTGAGVDSVLCLHVDNERFVPGGGLNPPMVVDVSLRVQIIRVTDGRLLFDQTLEYQGDAQPFTRWGENHAKLFRAELEVAQRTFAGVIFDELSN
jgi:hypothetical protein